MPPTIMVTVGIPLLAALLVLQAARPAATATASAAASGRAGRRRIISRRACLPGLLGPVPGSVMLELFMDLLLSSLRKGMAGKRARPRGNGKADGSMRDGVWA